MNATTAEPAEKTVLIVDSSEEIRDVLSTALERRGVRTFATPLVRRGAALAREKRPDVIVFDVETGLAAPRRTFESFARDAQSNSVPIVAIGSAQFEAPVGERDFIAKPYHFAPLLQKIEALLNETSDIINETSENIIDETQE